MLCSQHHKVCEQVCYCNSHQHVQHFHKLHTAAGISQVDIVMHLSGTAILQLQLLTENISTRPFSSGQPHVQSAINVSAYRTQLILYHQKCSTCTFFTQCVKLLSSVTDVSFWNKKKGLHSIGKLYQKPRRISEYQKSKNGLSKNSYVTENNLHLHF